MPGEAFVILLFGIVVAVGIVLILSAVDGPLPGGEKWEMEYNERWFADNKYCMRCGRLMEWVPEGGLHYDQRDGRPYMQQTWGCVVDGHTFNGLIPRCQRRDYGDATTPEA